MTNGVKTQDVTFEIFHTISPLKEIWVDFDVLSLQLIEDGKKKPIEYSFYQSYAWNEFVEEYYKQHSSRFKRLDYILMKVDGEPKAILPLRVTLFPKRKIEMTSWRTAGICNVVSPWNVAGHEDVFKSLVGFMTERYKGYEIRLFDMPVETPFVKALAELPGAKESLRDSYHIPLKDFENFDAYYLSLSKKLRHNIQTRSNHFTHGDLRWELKIYDRNNPPTEKQWLRIWRIFYCRKLQWNKKASNLFRRIVCEWEARREVKSGMKVTSFNALDEARLFVYEINGEPAAFVFCYVSDGYIVVPKLAIDMRFRTHAPGILMLKEIMKWCYDNGIKDFDLCRGEEPYKQQMGGIPSQLSRVKIKN